MQNDDATALPGKAADRHVLKTKAHCQSDENDTTGNSGPRSGMVVKERGSETSRPRKRGVIPGVIGVTPD